MSYLHSSNAQTSPFYKNIFGMKWFFWVPFIQNQFNHNSIISSRLRVCVLILYHLQNFSHSGMYIIYFFQCDLSHRAITTHTWGWAVYKFQYCCLFNVCTCGWKQISSLFHKYKDKKMCQTSYMHHYLRSTGILEVSFQSSDWVNTFKKKQKQNWKPSFSELNIQTDWK